MSSAPAPDRYHAPLDPRELVALILPAGTCLTCLEPEGSPLHRELCEAGSDG